MIRRFVLGLAFSVGILAALAAGPALADDVTGTWLRETGLSKVKFGPCGGGAICGQLVWLKPGTETPAKIGQRLFFDMKPTGPKRLERQLQQSRRQQDLCRQDVALRRHADDGGLRHGRHDLSIVDLDARELT